MSDPHAEYELFVRLLDRVGYSDSDELYICGDMIDKGERSVALVKQVFALPGARPIMGNHEYEFLKYYNAVMREYDGDCDAALDRLRAYFPHDGELLDWDTVDAIESLPLYIETNDFICTHAGLPLLPDGRVTPPRLVGAEELLYNRKFKSPSLIPRASKCVFYGHTATTALISQPRIICYRRGEGKSIRDYAKIHLDTGVFVSGVLGCFSVDECRCYYVRKGG